LPFSEKLRGLGLNRTPASGWLGYIDTISEMDLGVGGPANNFNNFAIIGVWVLRPLAYH
jgi:hypothetical protein